MTSLASYMMGGLALVLALDFAAPSVATGVVRALSDGQPPASFAARFSPAASPQSSTSQMVDRSGKTARLPASAPNITTVSKSVINSDARPPVQSQGLKNPVREVERDETPATKPLKTPVGCDAAFSSLSRAAPARFIGRCVA